MVRDRLFLVLIVVLAVSGTATAKAPPVKSGSKTIRIAFQAKQKTLRVEVIGLSKKQLTRLQQRKLSSEQWATIFPVRVHNGRKTANDDVPVILGSWHFDADRVVFTPRYPFQAGVSYRASFNLRNAFGKNAGRAVSRQFSLPNAKPIRPPVVTHVFPSGAVLPENLLKFYIHFSVPMSRGEAYDRVSLVTAHGKKVPRPFLRLEQELWDRSGTRFTLYFEPGRIKRGLRPRDELGPALKQGKTYVLRIDSRWRTADGNRLVRKFEKKFRVAAADRKQPDPRRWKVVSPQPGTRNPLTIQFDEPLDHAMLNRVIGIRDANGDAVHGTVSIGRNEQRWRFSPQKPWRRGRYVIRIDTRLEDRSGNSVGRPFEVRIDRTKKRATPPKSVDLPFQVPAPTSNEPRP